MVILRRQTTSGIGRATGTASILAFMAVGCAHFGQDVRERECSGRVYREGSLQAKEDLRQGGLLNADGLRFSLDALNGFRVELVDADPRTSKRYPRGYAKVHIFDSDNRLVDVFRLTSKDSCSLPKLGFGIQINEMSIGYINVGNFLIDNVIEVGIAKVSIIHCHNYK